MSFRTKLLGARIRNAKEQFKNSKLFLAIVMLAIGVSWTVNYYEFKELWEEYQGVMRYVEDRYPMTSQITIVNAAEAATEAPIEEPAVEAPKVDDGVEDVANTIFALESSRGVNDGCIRKGLGFNGYGFRQNSKEWKCFGSRDEVRGLLTEWIKDKQAKGLSTDSMLCLDNTGVASPSCWYSEQAKLL
jgi:hypothetical protein